MNNTYTVPTTTAAYNDAEETHLDRLEAAYVKLARENDDLRQELTRLSAMLPQTTDEVTF